jgi:hypothetical protein
MRAGFAGAAALLAFCAAAAAAAAAGAAPPTGDPKELALLERVHRAYRTVPAVGISLRLGAASFDYKLVLRSGIGVAEQVVVPVSIGGESAVFVIDRKSQVIRSIVVTNPQTSYVEQVSALSPGAQARLSNASLLILRRSRG